MAAVAENWMKEGRLRAQPASSATLMSNLGFKRYLNGIGPSRWSARG